MKTALVIVSLLTLLGVTVAWAIWGWEQTASTEMGFHGWLAMILGIVVTSLSGSDSWASCSTVAVTATTKGQAI